MTARPCGATRPPVQDAGWECTGRGLIVVYTPGGEPGPGSISGVPVVLPARALDVIEPDSWWDIPVKPFTGGDHLHLVVPRRPTTLKGDTLMTWGDGAYSAKHLRDLPGGGEAFIVIPNDGTPRGVIR